VYRDLPVDWAVALRNLTGQEPHALVNPDGEIAIRDEYETNRTGSVRIQRRTFLRRVGVGSRLGYRVIVDAPLLVTPVLVAEERMRARRVLNLGHARCVGE
jgi:hypothetical protein